MKRTNHIVIISACIFFGIVGMALAGSGFDVSTASYGGKFLNTVNEATSQPIGMSMKPDGTKVYVDDRVTKITYQYSLATAWDISTATYDTKNFNHSAVSNDTRSVLFNADGTKYYISDDTGGAVYQYSLGTAWDISTATYDTKSCSTASQDSRPEQTAFNSSGTKLFIIGAAGAAKDVYRYSLSVAYDVSTCTFDTGQSIDVTAQSSSPTGLAFNSTGKRMLVGDGGGNIYSYTLTAAYDLTTASYDSKSFNANPPSVSNRNIYLPVDENHIYDDDSATFKVYEFKICGCDASVTSSAGITTIGSGTIIINPSI